MLIHVVVVDELEAILETKKKKKPRPCDEISRRSQVTSEATMSHFVYGAMQLLSFSRKVITQGKLVKHRRSKIVECATVGNDDCDSMKTGQICALKSVDGHK